MFKVPDDLYNDPIYGHKPGGPSVRLDPCCETMRELMVDHAKHTHCSGCGTCIASTMKWVHQWCDNCRVRIMAALPTGATIPWDVYKTKR
jgi:hypothetical protein